MSNLKLDVHTSEGKTNGSADPPADIFDTEASVALMHQVVNAQLAAARQGTHATKTRGAVRGGGRKPFRQKGTGRARQGSIRAPHYTGGGTVQNRWASMADVPATTVESEAMSKELKRLGFRFVGPTICYAFMQATGIVNDHVLGCFRHDDCAAIAAGAERAG